MSEVNNLVDFTVPRVEDLGVVVSVKVKVFEDFEEKINYILIIFN